MKFFSSLMVATTAVLSTANAAAPSATPSGFPTLPSIPKDCLDIPLVVGDKPLKLMHYFHEEVCEKANCTATINDHNKYFENTVYPKVLADVNQRLGISSSDKKLFKSAHEQVVRAVEKSCTSQGNQPLCNDLKGVFEWGACAFKAAQPIFMNHVKELSGAVELTDDKCKKVKALDSDPTVWSKTLPRYVDIFVKQCKN